MTDGTSPLFDWRAAVVGSSLPATARHVALTLSLHMNEQGGSCYPSVETLAAETGLSRRAVQKTVGVLVAGGWLRLIRGGGRGRSNRYEAASPASIDPETAHPIQRTSNAESETVNQKTERVHLTTPKGAPGAPEVVSNSPEDVIDARRTPEASTNGHRTNGHAAAPRKAKKPDPKGFADCWEHYPRKLNRKGAADAFRARLKAGADPTELAAATRSYAQAMAGKDPQFVMHGSTFFGPNDRWRDYLPSGPQTPVNGNGAAPHRPNGRVSMTAEERAQLGITVGATS